MNDLPVILRTHELYNIISRITEKLPGLQRQTLGRRSEDAVLEILAQTDDIAAQIGGWQKSVQ